MLLFSEAHQICALSKCSYMYFYAVVPLNPLFVPWELVHRCLSLNSS
uniref:Uncharacterized protein n=1 Tax=Arundo donax TaxID=35708 RepID=A0A0A9A7W6_ARUDO